MWEKLDLSSLSLYFYAKDEGAIRELLVFDEEYDLEERHEYEDKVWIHLDDHEGFEALCASTGLRFCAKAQHFDLYDLVRLVVASGKPNEPALFLDISYLTSRPWGETSPAELIRCGLAAEAFLEAAVEFNVEWDSGVDVVSALTQCAALGRWLELLLEKDGPQRWTTGYGQELLDAHHEYHAKVKNSTPD